MNLIIDPAIKTVYLVVTVSLVKDEEIDTFISKVGASYEAKIVIKPEFYIAEIGDGTCKINYNIGCL